MKQPFKTSIRNGKMELQRPERINYKNNFFIKPVVLIKAGVMILGNRLFSEKPFPGREKEIIDAIYKERFSGKNPYLISAGHFYQLYPRNLGMFNAALLDPRVATSDGIWIDRQSIGLRSLAYGLEIMRQAKRDFTTIVPVWGNIHTAFNVYRRPSDTLFSMLYTLKALQDSRFISNLFPMDKRVPAHKLITQAATGKLLSEYGSSLSLLIKQYADELQDKGTGLVRKDLLLSAMRDGIMRQSSFYDNVVSWATIKLAKDLGLYEICEARLKCRRDKILDAFWDGKKGKFNDEFGTDSWCGDAFIALQSGFLNPRNGDDRKYLKSMVEYVRKNELDRPFPLCYSPKDELHRLYWPVRLTAPSYMGRTIWSHWGMEYIKTLVLLGSKEYLDEAQNHLRSYRENIERHGGYPEVYDVEGNMYETPFYRSLLHTSWVINYEQVKTLLENAT